MKPPVGIAYADNIFILIAGLSIYQLPAGKGLQTSPHSTLPNPRPFGSCWA